MSTTKRKARTPRKPRTTNKPQAAGESPQAIAQAIGQALGRTLGDLLGGNAPAAAVHLWTAERRTIGGEDAVVCTAAPNPFGTEPADVGGLPFGGPIGEAVARLASAVGTSIGLTERERERLAPLLSPPPPTADKPVSSPSIATHNVAILLHDIADRLFADNRERIGILERLEIET